MAQVPYNSIVGVAYAHINTATTTVVKPVPGMLSAIIFNSASSGATVTIYDQTSAAAPIVGVITLSAAETTPAQPVVFNVTLKNGLTIVTTGTLDITVTFR